jgi:hypothetical protein
VVTAEEDVTAIWNPCPVNCDDYILLESDLEQADLNPTLLTKQSRVKILSLDKSFCMKITLS